MYSYELTWVSQYNEVPVFITLFQLASIPTSIATTGFRSDAPYKHAQWNIEKYSTPMEPSDWSILRAYSTRHRNVPVIESYNGGRMEETL